MRLVYLHSSSQRTKRKSSVKQLARSLAHLLIVLISTVVGFGLGFTVASAIDRGIFVAWEPVPLPNDHQPDHFVVGEGPNVYIETSHGKLLVLCLSYFAQGSTWQGVEQVNLEEDVCEYANGYCSLEGRHRPYLVRQPPGIVVEQLDCHVCEMPGCIVYRYVILDRHKVWRWSKRSLDIGEVFMLYSLCYLCFTVGGALLGVWVVNRWHKSRITPAPENV